MSPSVLLRPVRDSDSDSLLAWRNDPFTRIASLSRRRISRRSHEHWFQCARPRTMWIAYDTTEMLPKDVGVFRCDWLRSGTYEVSVIVAPQHRRRGYGKAIIMAGTRQMHNGYKASLLMATIRIENAASIRAFSACGYEWVTASADRRLIYMAHRTIADA